MEANLKVIRGIENNNNNIIKKSSGVGLGNFDGLHIGHMALINTLISGCRIEELSSVVYTFTKHPEQILRKKLFTPLINATQQKINILRETSLNYLYFEEFDEEFSRLEPEEFINNIILDKLKAKLVVVGFDYRFGFKGSGDTMLLKELAEKNKFKLIIIPPIKINNRIVSSTYIREQIFKGHINRVFKLLGRHYSIMGKVVRGRRIGNTIGFPTANIIPESYLIMPPSGVYITRTLIDGKIYDGATNIGNNPTFKDQKHITVETHLLNFKGDLYDREIEVFFISKLRGEKVFDNAQQLVTQIEDDIIKVSEYFES